MDWAKTTTKRDQNHLSFGIWCDLYHRFYGTYIHLIYLVHDRSLSTCIEKKLMSWTRFTDNKWVIIIQNSVIVLEFVDKSSPTKLISLSHSVHMYLSRRSTRLLSLIIDYYMFCATTIQLYIYGDWNIGLNSFPSEQNSHHFADDIFKRIFLNWIVRISIKNSRGYMTVISNV